MKITELAMLWLKCLELVMKTDHDELSYEGQKVLANIIYNDAIEATK